MYKPIYVKKSFLVVFVRNLNICGRILTQFTGLLRTNTVAAKHDLLAERTGLGKSVSVSLRKNGPLWDLPWRRSQDCFYRALVLKRFSKRKEFSKFAGQLYLQLLVQNIETILNWHVNVRKNYSKPPRFDETSSVRYWLTNLNSSFRKRTMKSKAPA